MRSGAVGDDPIIAIDIPMPGATFCRLAGGRREWNHPWVRSAVVVHGDHDLAVLADALVAVGVAVRDVVRGTQDRRDGDVVRVGDSLFLYTDGVVESEDPAGEAFGMDRLQTLLIEERCA